MKRSRVRFHLRGSTWLIPMRYPTSIATDEPLPLPGGLSSRGVSGWASPRSSMMPWAMRAISLYSSRNPAMPCEAINRNSSSKRSSTRLDMEP